MFIRVRESAPKLRELVSKAEGGCVSAWFHMASRARTRAAESYRMAVGLGQAKVHIPGKFDWLLALWGI